MEPPSKKRQEMNMKNISLPFALVFCLLFIPTAFADCRMSCPPAETCMKAQSIPCDRGEEMGMMMFCAMIKSQEDMKAVLKRVLVLQQRVLNASVKEKAKIKAEIDDLIKILDAVPDMMDCPMMYLEHEGCMDGDVQPPHDAKEKPQSPAQHRSR